MDSLEELDFSSHKSTWGDNDVKYRSAQLKTLGQPGIFAGQGVTGGYAQSIGTTDGSFMVNVSDSGNLSNSYTLTSAMGMK